MLDAILGMMSGGSQMAFSAIQNRKARQFAERMYRHRYQYMVEDLKNAGLNPLLAVGSSPGGVNAPSMLAGTADPYQSAKAGILAAEEVKQAKATTRSMEARRKIDEAEAALKPLETDIKTEIGEWIRNLWSSGKDVADDVVKLSAFLGPASGKSQAKTSVGKQKVKIPRDPSQEGYMAPGTYSGSSGGTYYWRD